MSASSALDFVPSPRVSRALVVTALAGGLLFLAGVLLAPTRAFGGYLMGSVCFTGLALAGPLFLSLLTLCGARWHEPLRRVPEALGAALPVAFLLALGLLPGIHALYEWSHAEVLRQDALLAHKSAWLNPSGFGLRLVLAFGAWILLGRLVLRSRAEGPGSDRARALRRSAAFLFLFAPTYSLASIDWIGSLEPHWFSTLFALRTLSGLASAGLAFCILALVALRPRPAWKELLPRELLDDLGKLLMALTLLWAYVWYCQYMIQWYSNIPEETGYHELRKAGDWLTLSRLSLVLCFGLPFTTLLLRSFRRKPAVLARVAACVLLGHALDLFLLVAPPLQGASPSLGPWELGPLVGALALFTALFRRALSGAPRRAGRPAAPELAGSFDPAPAGSSR